MMRTTKPTSYFRQDFNRAKKDPLGHRLDAMLAKVTDMLAADMPLPARLHDHPLSGSFDDFRDCQVDTEVVLIYRKPDAYTLELVRLTHDIFRLMKVRNAKQRDVPFEPLVPGSTTVAAINEARSGGLTSFANSKALLKWLNADD
jgi:mRNA interferase YafQ